MKCVKFLLLALSLATTTHVKAETIDVSVGLGGYVAPTNSAAKFCVKLTFIKKNTGTLFTGLTTTKIKPIRIVELSQLQTSNQPVLKNFNVSFTLAASTTPVQAGVYDFCMTPTAGTVWKKTTTPIPTSYFYYVDAVVLGLGVTPPFPDNGVFSLLLN
ncbi:MAG: hypothetical protein IPN42_16870 [Methylococcaceae bacterium]|nr:hypothetical protein [Methylococcaceae bacterium]